MNINKEILKTIKYFSFFAYYPTLDEIHTFLQIKINKGELKKELDRLKYTPPQYSIRRKISKRKLQNWRFKTYIKTLTAFPQIKLVGLSGSIAMMNADLDDDIDLFIIASKNRLFTARFLATVLAMIMGLKRKIEQYKAPKKICLNLFFDESNLTVPLSKKTEFVGHEILQMKPIIVKGDIYERFLKANRWVFKLFPNAKQIFNQFKNLNFKNSKLSENLSDWVEYQLKKFQLQLINKHKTTEIITSTQLWFHPVDFGKKIKKRSHTTASVG
jgi:hypothetical protein